MHLTFKSICAIIISSGNMGKYTDFIPFGLGCKIIYEGDIMNFFLVIAFLFAVGSIIGWGLEVIYRKFFSASNPQRKWINPGFLIGPYLPLYGCSLVILFLLSQIETLVPVENMVLRKITLFIIMALAITAMEYFTGLIFIVKMNIKLWDYTNNFGNIKGIICPKYTFFWYILSALYYFLINPHIINTLNWLSENLAFSFFIGFFYGIFIIDLVNSAKIIDKIRQYAKDNEIIVLIDELKKQILTFKENRAENRKFLFALYSSENLLEHLKKYKESLRENRKKLVKNLEDIKVKRKP